MTRKYSNYGHSPEAFTQAWQTSKTIDEVAAKLKMPPHTAREYASRFRRKGIPLKRYRPSHEEHLASLKAAKALAKKLAK